ncbi:hypothetical protein [Bradyrhizobium sp. 15]|uniref:hypothetical protein n=1 Tax=Bradyrhizobium sp. 15 TaxID=2782633 RepID=UPI001FF892F3|nr:hypothetical protein [Bradyrhizobium sp. 15]MCK1440558.1 hypothetical protein [Bradyrhizobium sp. 15]
MTAVPEYQDHWCVQGNQSAVFVVQLGSEFPHYTTVFCKNDGFAHVSNRTRQFGQPIGSASFGTSTSLTLDSTRHALEAAAAVLQSWRTASALLIMI